MIRMFVGIRWQRPAALSLMVCVAVAGCTSSTTESGTDAKSAAPQAEPETAIAASAPRPSLGDFGFDATGMDRTVKPGEDFFDFVNGAWVKATEIPADRSSYSTFTMLSEQAEKDSRTILEAAASDSSADAEYRKIGDYYAAFMDEADIERKGIAPIQSELDAIAALADKKALSRAFGASMRADVDLLNATDRDTDRLFGVWINANLKQPDTYVPYLVQGGLGMPDRDFYLGDGRMADLRRQYEAHVARVFELAGIADGKTKAAKIIALEIAIAKVHATALETDDVENGANTWMQSDFTVKAPGIDWNAFLDGAGLAAQQEFIVWQPKSVAGIAAIVARQPLADWKDYLVFHAIERASPYLSKAFVDEHFAFNGKSISGTPELRERWKRAVAEANGALGEAIGKIYVQEHLSAETKARANDMVANLIAAFGKRIDTAEWMTPHTRQRAKAKLAGLKVGMGYPDSWRDYSGLQVSRDDAIGNAERAGLFEYRRNLAKLGQPIDRGEWFMLPQTVNALNIPLENRLIFPAAILQAPFFDGAADDAINYGGIGGVIGHEISHSFDNNGALFDETGKLENWWTKEDFAKFEAAGDALAAQYDRYMPLPDLAVNGKLTLGENIADVAGLATAYDAYTLAHAGKPAETINGFTPDQRVFLGWAQIWRSTFREQALRNTVLTNGHSPGHYRAQTVRNIDAWYPAFDVKEGQALHLAPDARVKIW